MSLPSSTAATPPPRGGTSTGVHLVRVLGVGGARPSTVVLGDAEVPIGREAAVAGPLALADGEVSRQHATLRRDGERWAIVDHASRNGTFVDGKRVTTAALGDGAVIRVGKTLMAYVHGEVRAEDELAVPLGTALAGDSLAMLRIHSEIGLVAQHPVGVLVLGETGAGKELIAQEIHRRSGRGGAFVAVNCAAISPALAESELFGHVSGAFTGAARSSEGLFVAAEGGTLFLDEIGELPLDLQPKLLRALATGEVRAVGSAATRHVDVRIVAATLRDLSTAAQAGGFRPDLLNRLSGWRLAVPPLRARRDDVAAIATAILDRRGTLALSIDAAEALVLHDWPGNVRELEHVLSAAVIRAGVGATTIELSHLPPEIAARLEGRAVATGGPPPSLPLTMVAPRDAVPTRAELCALLARFAGNVARVADHFAKDRHQIYRWARRYDVDLDQFRPAGGAREPDDER